MAWRALCEFQAAGAVLTVMARSTLNLQVRDYGQGCGERQGEVPPSVSINVLTKAAGLIEQMGTYRLPKRKPPKGPARR